MKPVARILLPLCLAAIVAACGGGDPASGTDLPGSDGVAPVDVPNPPDDGPRPDAVPSDGEAPGDAGTDDGGAGDLPAGDPGADGLSPDVLPPADLPPDGPADPGTPGDCQPNGDVRQVPCGGLNGRAVLEQTCTLGSWEETGPCTDPDLCVDDDTRTVPCEDASGGDETQQCREGRWVFLGDCRPAAQCAEGAERQVPCGLNGNGDQAQACVGGAWVDEGACDDPDECEEGSTRSVPCGINAIGLAPRDCQAGQWVQGPCAMNLAPRMDLPKVLQAEGRLPWVYRIVAAGGKGFIHFENGLRSDDIHVWDPAVGAALPMEPRFIRRGRCAEAGGLKAAGDRLFLIRDDGVHGSEAFLTDGTEEGTVRLGDLAPGRDGIYQSASQAQSATFDGTTFFYASLEDRWHLFASVDGGTPKDLGHVGPGDTAQFGMLEGILHFNGFDTTNGCALWRSDGTAAGTSRLVDFQPNGNTEKCPEGFTELGGLLYFTLAEAGSTGGLWRTDGTAKGTVRFAGSSGATVNGVSGVTLLLAAGDRLFFSASDGTYKSELWQTDGTAAGTRRLTSLGGGDNAFVSSAVVVGGFLYFDAVATGKGRELHRIPLTGASPQAALVKDLIPGPEGSPLSFEVELGGKLYFAYRDATGENRLHVSDGTEAGTYALGRDDARLDGTVAAMARVGDSLLAAVKQPAGGHRVYRFRPGLGATEVVLPAARTGGLAGVPAAALPDGRLVFAAEEGSGGLQPWVSDGSAKGTLLLSAVADEDDEQNFYHGFQRLGDLVLFRVARASSGQEPWVTDGTSKATRLLRDVRAGADGSFPGEMAVFGNQAFFAARAADTGREPWVTDGTEAGTRILGDVEAGTDGSNPGYFAGIPPAGKDQPWTVLFSASTLGQGTELWASRGSGAQFLDIRPGQHSAEPRYLAAAGSRVFFSAYDETNGRELWGTDGTTGGTAMMKDAVAGAGSANPDWLVPWTDGKGASRILYSASGDAGGRELWSSSGPDRDTALLADLSPKGGSNPAELHVTGDTLLFSAIHGANGREPFLMDLSTGAVTRLDLREGPPGSDPHGFFSWGDTYTFFSADDGVAGQELWVTDGTAQGTARVADLNPGPEGSHPWILGRSVDRLYIQAWTASQGLQLHVLDLATRP